MKKILSWVKKHKFLSVIFALIIGFILLVIGLNIYSNFFSYEKVPYCEDGYELEDDECVKLLTDEVIGYECEDNKNYYNAKDREIDCRLKDEFVVEPTVTKKCRDGFEENTFIDETTGEKRLECWGQTGTTYGGIMPEEIYSCPDGYTLKSALVGNSSEKRYILNSVADKEYQVSAKPICSKGYSYQVVDHELRKEIKRNNAILDYLDKIYGKSSNNKHELVDVWGCGKTITEKPKYKKVYD